MPEHPQEHDEEIPPYMDEVAFRLPGWPGYRNRPGRSGLDYLDNEFELAHMEGLFLRRLFTGRLRTSSPVYLSGMALLGVLCLLPLLLALLFPAPGQQSLIGWCFFLPIAIFGTALLINFALNVRQR